VGVGGGGDDGWVDLRFSAALWEYDGPAAWHFVTVPVDVADEIRLVAGEPRGFGSVRVEATIGASTFATSVFPDASSGGFVLPVKKAVRLAKDLDDGDTCEVGLRVVDG
jgi:hypothetical protein